MGGLDTVTQKSVENKMKRIQESELRQDKASSSSLPGIEKVLVSEMEEIEDDIGDDDFVAPVEKKAKKPDKIPLLVPRNITKSVALNSKRFKISDVATTSNLALIIKESGGNLDDFVLSTRTCRREGVQVYGRSVPVELRLASNDCENENIQPTIPPWADLASHFRAP